MAVQPLESKGAAAAGFMFPFVYFLVVIIIILSSSIQYTHHSVTASLHRDLERAYANRDIFNIFCVCIMCTRADGALRVILGAAAVYGSPGNNKFWEPLIAAAVGHCVVSSIILLWR